MRQYEHPEKTKSPFKYVGGKAKALPHLHKHMPKAFNRYFECFLGGGSLFFSLAHLNKEFFINDFSTELITTYRVIRDHPIELIDDLKKHLNNKDYFLKIRGLDRRDDFELMSDIDRASRFIYLNRSCFNGLWRVNKNNQNNVSFGHYKKLSFPSSEAILKCSKALQKATITNVDFEAMKTQIKPGDFIYLDPAYEKVSKTSSFTQYTNGDSGHELQSRIKDFCDHINRIGAYFIQSNSVAPFILETYKEYKIVKINMSRSINCKAALRGVLGIFPSKVT